MRFFYVTDPVIFQKNATFAFVLKIDLHFDLLGRSKTMAKWLKWLFFNIGGYLLGYIDENDM